MNLKAPNPQKARVRIRTRRLSGKRRFPFRKPTAYITLPCATELACDDVNSDIGERPITETEWVNSDGYLFSKSHIDGNRSEQQSLQPKVPVKAIRCSSEVSSSSPIGFN